METVIQVNPQDDFHLELKFDTGEYRLFDIRPYLDRGIFHKLRDPALFRAAYIAIDTVCWPGNLDLAPETLYDGSVSICGQTLLTKRLQPCVA